MSTDDAGNSLRRNTRSGGAGTATKSDYDESEEPKGFFANFRKQIANFGKKNNTRSQGVIDHIDQVDLMDLAEDLGCISAEDQSFTFKPQSNSNDQGAEKSSNQRRREYSDSKQHSHGLTFSDKSIDVNSTYEGNIVCKKPVKVQK